MCKWVQNRLKRDSRHSLKFITVSSTCGGQTLHVPPPPHTLRVRDCRILSAQKPFHNDQQFGHFEVEQRADGGRRLNAFMAVAKAVYDGRTAVRYWHAAD